MAEISKLQRADELREPPVVGRRYLVPTVLYPWYGKVNAWPVMGPKHTDAEHIGFDHDHYHVDIRFLSDAQVRRIEKASFEYDIATVAARSPLSTRGDGPNATDPHPEPVLKRLTCRRASHSYPSWLVARQTWMPRLVAAYAGRRCGRDAGGRLICPHKGFALDSLVPDERGRVVCPLHGLVIDVRAGTVIGAPSPRPDAAAGAR